MKELTAIRDHLAALYGAALGHATFEQLRTRLLSFPTPRRQKGTEVNLSERDAILITYGDQLREPDRAPLHTLAEFCTAHLRGVVSGIHLLPFYPYSSDDGFSVIDYRQVDPALGTWDDIAHLGQSFRLMFDGVINHLSAQSEWFRAFLRDDPRYRDYFIVVEGDPDLSQVVRPRALPLLTEFTTPSGAKKVWTTFSADQIDLNYANPNVLLDISDVLLSYVAQGAELIRLDAIAYLWKEIGTPCLHLPQTHRVIQLLRAVLDEVAPHVLLITETNVPHRDNLSYFGDGRNEAQLVYNFALPPLTLHTFRTGNAATLTQWAADLATPSRETTFFNFLASHDGIGLNPVRGILHAAEIDALVQQATAHGGRVSYKHNRDGSRGPYELNINYFDALSDPAGEEALSLQIDRFVAAHAIMLSLAGVPGIYFHSLFGSRGWPEGIALTGQKRTLNRQKFDRVEVERELLDPQARRHQVFARLKQLLHIRSASSAFHPQSAQQVPTLSDQVFAIERTSATEQVLCLHNVTSQPQAIQLKSEWQAATDLIATRQMTGHPVRLAPYQVVWLRRE
ncbi:MAG TPA: sugar phosphorylase [Anaerolineae bacterium]|nr:sugar phosphorylase [Anaerolineae bacterium]